MSSGVSQSAPLVGGLEQGDPSWKAGDMMGIGDMLGKV